MLALVSCHGHDTGATSEKSLPSSVHCKADQGIGRECQTSKLPWNRDSWKEGPIEQTAGRSASNRRWRLCWYTPCAERKASFKHFRRRAACRSSTRSRARCCCPSTSENSERTCERQWPRRACSLGAVGSQWSTGINSFCTPFRHTAPRQKGLGSTILTYKRQDWGIKLVTW